MEGKSTVQADLHMPLANLNPEPRPFQQYVSEVPNGPIASVKPAVYQYTRQSTRRKIKGNATFAAYILKHQSREAVFAISEIYSVIRDLVFNFDRTHEESFFEAYPHLLIEDNQTVDSEVTPTRRLELRRDYRKYANRLAHFYFFYADLHDRWTEQLVTLLNCTRFNGETEDKDIASLARWSVINRRTALFNSFLSPQGSINAILNQAKYAIGSGVNGQTIIAFPLWDSSIYGNVGNHAGSLKEMFTDRSLQEADATAEGSASAMMPCNQFEFAQNVKTPSFTDADQYDAIIFKRNQVATAGAYRRISSYPILNPATLSFPKASGTIHVPLAQPSIGFDAADEPKDSTAITDVVWHNFKEIEAIIQAEFPEMRDPNNDLYQFAANQLHLFEMPMTVERMLSAVRDAPFYDITQLRERMQFRSRGEVNTSTVIGQTLPLTKNAYSISPISQSYIYPGKLTKQFRENDLTFFSRPNGGRLAKFVDGKGTEYSYSATSVTGSVLCKFVSKSPAAGYDVVQTTGSQLAITDISDAQFAAISSDPTQSYEDAGVYYSYVKQTAGGKKVVLVSNPSVQLGTVTDDQYNAIVADGTASFLAGQEYQSYVRTIFEENFEKFPLHQDDASLWLAQARRSPGVTPRVFTHAAFKAEATSSPLQPIVLNAISSDGTLLASSMGFQDTGKYASMLDLATRSNLDTQNAVIEFNGVTASDAIKLVDRKDGFICYERPEQVWKYQKPSIDTSDPFQCGFYLLYGSNSVIDQSELAVQFSNQGSFSQALPPTTREIESVTVANKKIITGDVSYETISGSSKEYSTRFTVYKNTPHYALLFMGAGIFMPPQALSMQDGYALPYEVSKEIPAFSPSSVTDLKPTQQFAMGMFVKLMNILKADEASLSSGDNASLTTVIKPGNFADSLALFRLASLPALATRELTDEAAIRVANGGSYTKYYKPSGYLATLLADTVSDDAACRLYMFNPQYGPVAIESAPLPVEAMAHTAPSRETLATYARGALGADMALCLGAFKDSTDTIDLNDRLAFISTRTNSHLWSWWIRKVSYNGAYVDKLGVPQVVDKLPILLDDAIRAKWPLALFESVGVNYAGTGDMKYFHDYQKGSAAFREDLESPTASGYPTQNIVTEPRRSRDSQQISRMNTSGKDRSVNSYSTAAVSSNYVAPAATKEEDKPFKSHKRRNHRRHGKPAFKTGPKPESSPAVEIADLKPKDDSAFDQSSKAQDKTVTEDSKKRIDSTALMN